MQFRFAGFFFFFPISEINLSSIFRIAVHQQANAKCNRCIGKEPSALLLLLALHFGDGHWGKKAHNLTTSFIRCTEKEVL